VLAVLEMEHATRIDSSLTSHVKLPATVITYN